MRKILFSIFLVFGALAVNGKDFDRGLGNPSSEYIPKGSFQIGISGSYNKFDSGSLNEGPGASFYGLADNLSGNMTAGNVSLHAAYFFAKNMSLGGRFSYGNTVLDLDSASLLSVMDAKREMS